MPNIRLEIEFDGAAYFGWQYQPNRPTVQAAIELAVSRLYQSEVGVTGVGRTDTGVSALAYVASFQAPRDLPARSIQAALNQRLPSDIRVRKAETAPDAFHARFDARSKTYRYTIAREESPLAGRCAWVVTGPFDLGSMRRAAKLLTGTHDFMPFCRVKVENGLVTVRRVSIREKRSQLFDTRLVQIEIEANRFLYKMVRRIVGTLVDIGRGKFPIEELRQAVHNKPRVQFSTAPARGLLLVKVKY